MSLWMSSGSSWLRSVGEGGALRRCLVRTDVQCVDLWRAHDACFALGLFTGRGPGSSQQEAEGSHGLDVYLRVGPGPRWGRFWLPSMVVLT